MTAFGTKRTWQDVRLFVRFWREADVGQIATCFGPTQMTHSVIDRPIFAVMHNAALDPLI
jgi:hypothetical protein